MNPPTKWEKNKENILLNFLALRVMSTYQVGRVNFRGIGSPWKRASKALLELEEAGLIEGMPNRPLQSPKLWRLSNVGRKLLGVDYDPPRFSSARIWHMARISDVYLDICDIDGKPRTFDVELREKEFTFKGERTRYTPDAFFGFRGRPYLLELQTEKSPLSAKRWGLKLEKAHHFLTHHLADATWQKYGSGRLILPQVLIITEQSVEKVLEYVPHELDVIVVKSIHELGGGNVVHRHQP